MATDKQSIQQTQKRHGSNDFYVPLVCCIVCLSVVAQKDCDVAPKMFVIMYMYYRNVWACVTASAIGKIQVALVC